MRHASRVPSRDQEDYASRDARPSSGIARRYSVYLQWFPATARLMGSASRREAASSSAMRLT